jgi:hypothetical protein
MEESAKRGDLEEVKRRHAAGEPFGNAADEAAFNGHLETLKWIGANGGEWTDDAADWAAFNGHLETLKWIRANGGEWTHWAADWAAKNGHLETLKWIRANGGEWTHWAVDWAAEWGHLGTLQWIVRANAPLPPSKLRLRTKAEQERRVAEETLDRHLIPDLARVAGDYLCLPAPR